MWQSSKCCAIDLNFSKTTAPLMAQGICVSASDSRYLKPGIKTTASTRQIPVSAMTASVVETSVRTIEGDRNPPFC